MIDIKLDKLQKIARLAGEEILKFYADEETFKRVDHKADDSPLTLADKAAHEVIERELKIAYPDVPLLSEEGASVAFEERVKWDAYFLVDPLDGTKEFINRNGEFTVNIALIERGKPVAGVVYVPFKDTMFSGTVSGGAFKAVGSNTPEKISVRPRPMGEAIAVRSKSHASVDEERVLSTFDVTDEVSVGSSLKFCMVAEGLADVYYRHGPTMEWDTGAGQAVLEAAGGRVYQGCEPRDAFVYNKKDLLNGSFLALGAEPVK